MTTDKKKTPTWVWVLLALVGLPMTLCTVGAIVAGTGAAKAVAEAKTTSETEKAELQAAVANEKPEPVAEPAPEPEPAGPRDAIPGDGTFLVGKDIQPGTYRGEPGRMGMCYWTRLKGLSGEFGDIIANDIAKGSTLVTIKETDKAFETKGCAGWELVE